MGRKQTLLTPLFTAALSARPDIEELFGDTVHGIKICFLVGNTACQIHNWRNEDEALGAASFGMPGSKLLETGRTGPNSRRTLGGVRHVGPKVQSAGVTDDGQVAAERR